MYENFGAAIDHKNKTVQFRLFFPDHRLDPSQYYLEYSLPDNGGINKANLPEIDLIKVIGDFQHSMIPPSQDWDEHAAPILTPAPYLEKGYLYLSEVLKLSHDGFYQFKYAITFKNQEKRYCNDPCTKYHSFSIDGNTIADGDKSGFVIGGASILATGLPKEVSPLQGLRLPLSQLIIYELFIDDFTAEYRGNRAPLDCIIAKIAYLKDLGINAVEFMPVNGCPCGEFSWGYNPAYHFAVTNRYANDNAKALEKLSLFKKVISTLHENGIQVILDLVLNHASKAFPYFELYEDPVMSPFVSVKEEWDSMDLDFYNNCTNEFVIDLCKYWLSEFKIDGLRLDYAKGYDFPLDSDHGLRKIIAALNDYIKANHSLNNTSIIIEYLDGYQCINTTNIINASGCWLDDYMWTVFRCLDKANKADKQIIRIINSAKDFAPGKSPVIYLGNHDHTSTVRKTDENNNFARHDWWRTQPYIILLMTSAGAPLLYNGQEWGENYWLPESKAEEEYAGIIRVTARPLHWRYSMDAKGSSLINIYRQLIAIRKEHPACQSTNFFPEDYSNRFTKEGYGFDYEAQVVIYHKWDDSSGEKLIIAVNFSDAEQTVNIPLSHSGDWLDLLSGKVYTAAPSCRLDNMTIPSSWGYIFTDRY